MSKIARSQKVRAHVSVSLDGFITGPDPSVEDGLGGGGAGESLHEWMFDERSGPEARADLDARAAARRNLGAIVLGRRMFDHGEVHWGPDPPFHVPVFVVTHEKRAPLVRQGGTTYHFANGGVSAAIEDAKRAAGGKDVGIWGGANVIQQAIRERLLDELDLHLVPVFLGGGTRLFDAMGPGPIHLERTSVSGDIDVTHLTFRLTA